jgi:homoserine kinase
MIEIKVPATSANFGPGFDCLGIALNMYNIFLVEEIETGLEINGCDEIFSNETNLMYKSMKESFKIIGYKPKGLKIKFESDIPISRGLGSSASCILAGVMAANEISKAGLNKNKILEIASEIEGHPDNIAPALFGGMTISIQENNQVYYDKIKIYDGLKFCALIPDFTLSTKESRSVLPDKVSYKDAVFNVGRVSLIISSLVNGNLDLINFACEDKLHQTYRGTLIEGFDEIIQESKLSDSLGVFLSGAGPSIMAILKEENNNFCSDMERFLTKFDNKWIVRELKIDFDGAVVKK